MQRCVSGEHASNLPVLPMPARLVEVAKGMCAGWEEAAAAAEAQGCATAYSSVGPRRLTYSGVHSALAIASALYLGCSIHV